MKTSIKINCLSTTEPVGKELQFLFPMIKILRKFLFTCLEPRKEQVRKGYLQVSRSQGL